MAKKLIRSWLPDAEKLSKISALNCLGPVLHQPGLWHLNRRSAAGAFAISFFVMFQPIPMQMLAAAALAIWLRYNLPLAISLVWISNPLTMGPMWYFGYWIGTKTVGGPDMSLLNVDEWHELLFLGSQAVKPLVIGCLLCGLVAAALGYGGLQLLWRISVVNDWQARRKVRLARTRQLMTDSISRSATRCASQCASKASATIHGAMSSTRQRGQGPAQAPDA